MIMALAAFITVTLMVEAMSLANAARRRSIEMDSEHFVRGLDMMCPIFRFHVIDYEPCSKFVITSEYCTSCAFVSLAHAPSTGCPSSVFLPLLFPQLVATKVDLKHTATQDDPDTAGRRLYQVLVYLFPFRCLTTFVVSNLIPCG